jgi:dolichol-phosphate mannosyltransferase
MTSQADLSREGRLGPAADNGRGVRDATIAGPAGGAVLIISALVDVLVFAAVTSAGIRLGSAHMASFAAATVCHYFLSLRPALAAAGRPWGLRLAGRLLVVGLMALFLRGAVLGLLSNAWSVPLPAAIVVAVIATMAITVPGYAFAISSSIWRIGSGPQWPVLAAAAVIYAFLVRLLYLGQMELIPEETYYWNYTNHLDIGYLDHPPMVAWLIRLGTLAFGNTEFGVRIGALCCAGIASWFAYGLTRNLFGTASALVAVVLMQVMPFVFLGGVLMTPDAALIAAWLATLYFLERALVAGRPMVWLPAGLCLGLGMISKYSIGLLVPAVLLFMVWDPPSRRGFSRWQPYVAAVLAVAVFSPVIIWNARHEWASFAFQTSRRLAEHPKFTLHMVIACALLLLTPTGVATLWVGCFGRGRKEAGAQAPGAVITGAGGAAATGAGGAAIGTVGAAAGAVSDAAVGAVGAAAAAVDIARRWRFIQLMVLVPLSVFVAFSLRHDVKLDWTGTPWLGAVPALAYFIVTYGAAPADRRQARLNAAWTPTVSIMLLLFGVIFHYLALGLPGVGYSKQMEVIPVGWNELGRQIGAVRDDLARKDGIAPLIVGMDRYSIASELAFYAFDRTAAVRETSSAHLFGEAGLMYERWVPIELQQGRSLLLVAWKAADLMGPRVESRAARLEPIHEGVLSRDGLVINHYYYRVAYGLRRLPPEIDGPQS